MSTTLPEEALSGLVRIRAGKVDGTPVSGSVLLAPSAPFLTYEDLMLLPEPVEITLDVNGNGEESVISNVAPNISPTGWAWRVRFDIPGLKVSAFHINVPVNGVVELAHAAHDSVAASPGTFITIDTTLRNEVYTARDETVAARNEAVAAVEQIGQADPEQIEAAVNSYLTENPPTVDLSSYYTQDEVDTAIGEIELMPGPSGSSAYAVALSQGFVGTEAEWLASLEGSPGDDGANGDNAYQVAVSHGFTGTEAEWLASLVGSPGKDGGPGKSAYQIWLDLGNVGTEADFLSSLKGADGQDGNNGSSAYQLAVNQGYSGTEAEWLESLNGADGDDGASAYQVAVSQGFSGTVEEWLISLEGSDGSNGTDGMGVVLVPTGDPDPVVTVATLLVNYTPPAV